MSRTTSMRITIPVALHESPEWAYMREQRALSGWVVEVLEAHTQEVLSALALLVSAGWSQAEILAACDALNGTWLRDHLGAGAIALELSDWWRFGGGERHEIEADRWSALISDIHDETARALVVVVTDFWRRGPVCRRLEG